jgi:hypothetical protein
LFQHCLALGLIVELELNDLFLAHGLARRRDAFA